MLAGGIYLSRELPFGVDTTGPYVVVRTSGPVGHCLIMPSGLGQG